MADNDSDNRPSKRADNDGSNRPSKNAENVVADNVGADNVGADNDSADRPSKRQKSQKSQKSPNNIKQGGNNNKQQKQQKKQQKQRGKSRDQPSLPPTTLVADLLALNSRPTPTTYSLTTSPTTPHLIALPPYTFAFKSNAKGRWVDKPLHATFSSEFQSYPPAYYTTALSSGRLAVNGHLVPPTYIVQQHDLITHLTHRHEPPVRILPPSHLACTESYVALSKPPCLPIHPCGSYHYNTVSSLLPPLLPPLATPPIKRDTNTSGLFFIHRLDRLTSGTVIVGRTSHFASEMGKAITGGGVTKIYVAKVKGKLGEPPTTVAAVGEMYEMLKENKVSDKFKSLTVDAGIEITDKKKGVYVCGTVDEVTAKKKLKGLPPSDPALYRASSTVITPFYYDSISNTTCVVARPVTGRTHQIRLHCEYLGCAIANDPNYHGGARPVLASANDDDDNDFMTPCSQGEWDGMMALKCFHCGVANKECECKVTAFLKDEAAMEKFVAKSCVFCWRKTNERALKEYAKRSKGIFLHAVKYCWEEGGVDVVDKFPTWVGGDEEGGELVVMT